MADNNNSNKRSTGTVTWFNGWKGFGFIAPDEQDSEDLFVHQTSINFEGYRTLHDGQRVEFDVEVGDDGRTRAINVDVLRNNTGNNNRPRSNNNNVECYNCGRFGHLARDCYNNQGGRGHGRGRRGGGRGGRFIDRGENDFQGYGRGREGSFIDRGENHDEDNVQGYGRGREGSFIDRGDNNDGEGYGRGRGSRGGGRGGRRGRGFYRGGQGGGRGGGGRGCFNCGEEGHFARDCPNNNNNPQN